MLGLHNTQAIDYEFRHRLGAQSPRHRELRPIDIVVKGLCVERSDVPFIEYIGLRKGESYLKFPQKSSSDKRPIESDGAKL
jgi:hypothetical protein